MGLGGIKVSESVICVMFYYFMVDTISPHSAPTFPGTCKRKFLCLQMISFEFLRVDSIG